MITSNKVYHPKKKHKILYHSSDLFFRIQLNSFNLKRYCCYYPIFIDIALISQLNIYKRTFHLSPPNIKTFVSHKHPARTYGPSFAMEPQNTHQRSVILPETLSQVLTGDLWECHACSRQGPSTEAWERYGTSSAMNFRPRLPRRASKFPTI